MKELFEFQKKIQSIKKNSINPHFKHKYADINTVLEVVKPLLNELEILMLQPLRDGKIHLELYNKEGIIFHSSEIALPEGLSPQQMGAAITYYRRYLIVSLFVLETEDTDGDLSIAKPEIAKVEIAPTAKAELTPALITSMKAAVKAGRKEAIEKRLETYNYTPEQKNEILNGN